MRSGEQQANGMPNLSRRQAAWVEKLQEYDCSLEYLPGEADTIADVPGRQAVYAPKCATCQRKVEVEAAVIQAEDSARSEELTQALDPRGTDGKEACDKDDFFHLLIAGLAEKDEDRKPRVPKPPTPRGEPNWTPIGRPRERGARPAGKRQATARDLRTRKAACMCAAKTAETWKTRPPSPRSQETESHTRIEAERGARDAVSDGHRQELWDCRDDRLRPRSEVAGEALSRRCGRWEATRG